MTLLTKSYVKGNYALLYDIITARCAEVDQPNTAEMQYFRTSTSFDRNESEDLTYCINEVKLMTVLQAIFGREHIATKSSCINGNYFPPTPYCYAGICELTGRRDVTLSELIVSKPVMTYCKDYKLRIIEGYEDGHWSWSVSSRHRVDFAKVEKIGVGV